MSEKTLEILDNAFRCALWVFLVVFLLLAAYALAKRRAEQGLDLVRAAYRAGIGAAVVAAVFFVVVTFTPVTFFRNFAYVSDLGSHPLRLTALVYERTYEGFSLQGEVWNQARDPLPDIQAEIQIWGKDEKLLDVRTVPLTPSSIPPGRPASFNLTYNDNSPFLYGYEVLFKSKDGQVIPHIKGFDAE